MTRLTDDRLTEIILQCDYATQHNQVAMVSTVEVAELARELEELRQAAQQLKNEADAEKLISYKLREELKTLDEEFGLSCTSAHLRGYDEAREEMRAEILAVRKSWDDAENQLAKLRGERFHASSYLDCSEQLKVARDALKDIVHTSAGFERGYLNVPSKTFIEHLTDVAREALAKIGEMK